ncbi:unnamed protein product [Rangifer tarandus platyrhynchus]|uniref:Uncharacterized protein n=2 Tax=Rangifer tarandus platyrhynchus TaxID=3082113 RepID=A0ACB0FMF3_RANTA|nr:unnamed protein product [Rangifer tarandus platyrhynchus]CAI9714323.1 unnamed protein product [Rangifer tarandus platyrhynchus]
MTGIFWVRAVTFISLLTLSCAPDSALGPGVLLRTPHHNEAVTRQIRRRGHPPEPLALADLAPSPPGPLVPLLVTGSQGYQPSSPQRPGMKKHLPRRPAEQWGKTKRKQSLCPELCPARAPHPELCPAQAPHGQLAGAHCLLLSTFIHGPVEPRQDPVLHQGCIVTVTSATGNEHTCGGTRLQPVQHTPCGSRRAPSRTGLRPSRTRELLV